MRSRGWGRVTRKSDAHVAGIAAQHDDAIGQQDGFFDIVRDEKDGSRGDGLLLPQLQQFAAQVLRGQHIERGEGLVHEEDFRLDDEGAGESDPLPHAAGELLGIGGLEAVQTDGVEDLEALLAALLRAHAARLQRRFDIFEHRQPGEKGKALEDDGDVGLRAARSAVPCQKTSPAEGFGEAGEHAQQRGFAGTRGPSSATISPGTIDRSVGAMTWMRFSLGCA